MPYIFIYGLGQNLSSGDKVISHMGEPKNVICLDLLVSLAKSEF